MARANAATPISRQPTAKRPTACQRLGLSADPPALFLALLASGLAPLPAAQAEVIKAAEPVSSAAAPAAGQAAAAAAAQASLALPGCRGALGLEGQAAAERLLANDPAMEAKLALTPASQAPGGSLSRLERLEGELAASRKRIADQQAQLAAETNRQDALARDLAELRRQLLGGAWLGLGPGPGLW